MNYTTPDISMLDTTSQAIASAGTPQVITFNTTGNNRKIVVTSSSRFTVNEAGYYRVDFIAQITASVANKTADIWLRVNGTDVTNSNTKITIVNNEIGLIGLTGFIVTLTAGQYVELWFNGDDTSVTLKAFAAGVTPTRPVTPSIFFAMEKLS